MNEENIQPSRGPNAHLNAHLGNFGFNNFGGYGYGNFGGHGFNNGVYGPGNFAGYPFNKQQLNQSLYGYKHAAFQPRAEEPSEEGVAQQPQQPKQVEPEYV